MLEKLGNSGERIFEATLTEDKKGLVLTGAANGHFSSTLTRAQVIELSSDFLKLAVQMEDKKGMILGY